VFLHHFGTVFFDAKVCSQPTTPEQWASLLADAAVSQTFRFDALVCSFLDYVGAFMNTILGLTFEVLALYRH
jgi:hypothetical protein